MLNDFRACLMSVNLHGIHEHKDLVDPSIKEMCNSFVKVFHCDGLLLCVTKDSTSLVVWNPYLGQTRWIKPKSDYHRLERYALGYDNNRNHKILRFLNCYDPNVGERILKYEIFDLKCNIWTVLDVTPDWYILNYSFRGVSAKGNNYFVAQERLEGVMTNFLLCFDFTKESFGPHLHLPFESYPDDDVTLSSVREEKLVVLFKKWIACEMEIWITTKIESHAVSWSYFMKLDRSVFNERLRDIDVSLFVDEKKKVALFFCKEEWTNFTAYMVGEGGYYKEKHLGESTTAWPFVYSYVPSWVQIQ